MKKPVAAAKYKRHRFPPEIIAHDVWLYFRFALSYRDGEELLAERGVILTYETVRAWCQRFGRADANELRRHPWPGDTCHLAEVFIQISALHPAPYRERRASARATSRPCTPPPPAAYAAQ